MTTFHSAPLLEIFRVREAEDFKPSESLHYELDLEGGEEDSDVYELEIGDLLAFTEVRPKCANDLKAVAASVRGVRNEITKLIPVVSSKLISWDGENEETRSTLFAVKLTNLTSNRRTWRALYQCGEGGNMDILNSVLRINPSGEEECGLCSEKEESSDLSKSRELIMSLGLNDSQRDAVLKCIALRECNHRNSVELIWGPPGTGKTKTIASLLFSLFRMKCRTLTCAPTNVAILGVAKRLVSCLSGRLELESYGLGDVILSGNGKRMKIVEQEDMFDVFLDYRISALLYCFKPLSGWKGSVKEMIHLLEDPDSMYLRYLEQLKDPEEVESEKEDDENEEEDVVENGSLKEKFQKGLLRKLIIYNAKHNKKMSKKKTEKVNSKERNKAKANGEDEVPFTFKEFFTDRMFRLAEQIALCTELLQTHMPTSCLALNKVKGMIRAVDMLQTLEKFMRANNWSKEALAGSASTLYGLRHKCLKELNLIRTTEVPEYFEPSEISNFCLKNACLIFSTVSGSSMLYGTAPFELVIIDEAAQVKECESTIPLQLPGLRHAILVGDEKQLPAMVTSEICKKAGYGRSLFERLVKLGHSKHLLNVQYRMHPSISLFPNQEFYANQIRNGPNVTQRDHERLFLEEKLFGSYSFINVTNGTEELVGKNSLKNMVEVSVVAEILSKLYKESMKFKEKVRVGCISPYNAQVFAMQESLGKTYSSDTKEKFSVNVRSVDGFQGGEEDIIIISTVRCNGNGNVGFLDNVQRANVALTRARHCLWILGNSETLQNSGTVWQRLIADAENRSCFHNAYDDTSLCQAIINALINLGQQRSLFAADSILFKTAEWKVCFSSEFHNSIITRYPDSEIQMEVASLLEKLSRGWRQQCKNEAGIPHEGASSQLFKSDVVRGELRLVWTIDILRKNSTKFQVINVLDILPQSELARAAKKLDSLVENYTNIQLVCRQYKLLDEGGLRLPMTWSIVNSPRIYYSSNDLATQVAAISLRN